jgi:hypothetical protein
MQAMHKAESPLNAFAFLTCNCELATGCKFTVAKEIMKNFLKVFQFIALLPQIAATATALYATVRKIDDDPAIREAFSEVKSSVLGAETIKTIRVQAAMLMTQIKQLTG